MSEMLSEIEFLQNKMKMLDRENKGDKEFREGLESLGGFDQKLKEVYSCCIDLYVSLNQE